MDYKKSVMEIISQVAGVSIDDLKPRSRFKEDLGMDSFNFIELKHALSLKGIPEIPEEDFYKLRTIADVIKFIDSKDQSEK